MSKKNLWPNEKRVIYSEHPGRAVIDKYLLPKVLRQIPASFDKIIENCDAISKWWLGAHIDKEFIGGCINEDKTLDFECVKEKLGKTASSIGLKSIGAGQYGATFMACNLGSCEYILKVQLADISFKREVYALYDLNDWEYSPRIYDAWTCMGVGFIVLEKMESIKKCLPRLSKADIKQQIDTMVSQLYTKNWIHNDIHPGNVMCKNGHLALIDFGAAVKMEDSDKVHGFKYFLKNHPFVTPDKFFPGTSKPPKINPGLKKEDLIEFETDTLANTINSISDIASVPKKRLKKAINVVRAGVKLKGRK